MSKAATTRNRRSPATRTRRPSALEDDRRPGLRRARHTDKPPLMRALPRRQQPRRKGHLAEFWRRRPSHQSKVDQADDFWHEVAPGAPDGFVIRKALFWRDDTAHRPEIVENTDDSLAPSMECLRRLTGEFSVIRQSGRRCQLRRKLAEYRLRLSGDARKPRHFEIPAVER